MARRRHVVSRSPTNYTWSLIEDFGNSIAGNTSTLLGSLPLSNQGIDETLLRVVGMISVETDQLIASEVQTGAFGMTLAKDPAITAGVTSLPTPLTEGGDDDWPVWIPFSNSFMFQSAVGVDRPIFTHYFDFKSKRVVHTGSALALVVQASTSSDGFNFSICARVLSMVRGT